MADPQEPASLIDAAQQAAAAGDYSAAERLLRDAAARQKADLGSDHPDLATTFNNLAFVCERTNKLDEAERLYRRAHAIAVASLPPGSPIIATSLKNLVEFCEAHEIPIWKPPAARDDAAPAEPAAPAAEPAVPEPEPAPAPFDSEPDFRDEPADETRRWSPRTMAVAGLSLAAVVVVVVVFFTRPSREPRSSAGPSPAPAVVSSPAPSLEPSPAASPGPGSDPSPAPSPEPSPAPKPVAGPERRREVSKEPVTVLTAQLCSALERRGSPDWKCAQATGDLQPGTYLFYTRLLTSAATTVEHRWYRGERVHQVMRLRVSPSPGTGYRTYSGNTISAERAGDWKVELRAADGSLLQEERFVVR